VFRGSDTYDEIELKQQDDDEVS